MAITDKDVFDAADELAAQGVRPTQTAVREHLGGGSFATIGPALKRWKAAQAEQSELAALAAVELPEALGEALQVLGGQVWQAAIAAAEAKLAAERAALAEVRKELEAEAAEAAEAVRQLEAEAEQQQQQIDDLDETLELVNKRNADQQEEIWQLQAKLKEVQAVADERISGLEARLQDAQRTIDRLTAARKE